jgi:hypothetical protein
MGVVHAARTVIQTWICHKTANWCCNITQHRENLPHDASAASRADIPNEEIPSQ